MKNGLAAKKEELMKENALLRLRVAELERNIYTMDAGEVLAERDRLREALREVRRLIVDESEMTCNHPCDDGSDSCGNIDDCMFHALVDVLARAALATLTTAEISEGVYDKVPMPSLLIEAQAVAAQIKEIGQELTTHDLYLQWIKMMEDCHKDNGNIATIYVPTEANIPILEATRRKP